MIIYAFEYIWIQLENNSKYQEICKWLGNLFIGSAATLFVIFPELGHAAWILLLFLIGHIVWSSMAIAMKDKALMALNGFFVLIDTYGLIIRL